jgi:hypothetical protein
MKEIEMCTRAGKRNLPAHAIAGFEQRPVERFAIECDQHPAFGEPLPQREEQRPLFAVVTHEQLFDFKSATLPPRETDKKRIGPAPTRKSGSLRIEKYPLFRVRNLLRRVGHQQL